MKKLKITTSILCILLFTLQGMAQIDITDQFKKDFDKFKSESEETFDEFVIANDQEFSEHLRKAWEQLQSVGQLKPPSDPKPKSKPVAEKKVELKPQEITIKADSAVEQPSVNSLSSAPIKPKSEPATFAVNEVTASFFGKDIDFSYDKYFLTTVETPVNNNVIADYWDMMIGTNHYQLIDQFQDIKTSMNLNDWGYYELVFATAQKICPTDLNAAKLLTWFILTKSNYQAKVGFSPNGVHLLLAFQNQIYSKPYFNVDGKKYYVLDRVDRLSTYRQDYKVATEEVSLDINSPLKIGAVIEKRNLTFEYENKTYNYTINYPLNDIAFYKSYPQADIKIYFDAAISDETRSSLVNSIKPDIAGKTPEEAANFLLAFVQKAFDYKTDPEQFGTEKFFFAEELFFYPFSDCEDRSVLFSFLVRELLGLKVVGLRFPGHMATAVAFPTDLKMTTLNYENTKYTICDPTYINATVGMCMPQFVNEVGVVVALR